MPPVRCRNYNDDGTGGPCPRLGKCEFIHPSEQGWSHARTTNVNRSGPPGPRKGKVDGNKRCWYFEEDGTPIRGGCKRPQCSFSHPTDPWWTNAEPDRGPFGSRKPESSASASGWARRNSGNGDQDDAMSGLSNRNKRKASVLDPWGTFGESSAPSTIDDSVGGWGNVGTGGLGASLTGGWGSSESSSTLAGGSVDTGGWGSEVIQNGGWSSSTTADWGSATPNEASTSMARGKNAGTSSSGTTAGRGPDVAKDIGSSGTTEKANLTGGWGSSETETGGWGSPYTAGDWRSKNASGSSGAAKTKEPVTGDGWGGRGENAPAATTRSGGRAAAEALSSTVSAATGSGSESGWASGADTARPRDSTGGLRPSSTPSGQSLGNQDIASLSPSAKRLPTPSEDRGSGHTLQNSAVSEDSPTIGQWGHRPSSTTDSTKPSLKFPSSLQGEGPRSASVTMLSPSPSLTNTSHRSMTFSAAKKPFAHSLKTEQEKREFLHAVINIISLALQARSEQREAESQRDRWKNNMASDVYSHGSLQVRERLESYRDDLDRKVRESCKKVAAFVSDLAQLPYGNRLNLGADDELEGLRSQIQEIKQWCQSASLTVKVAPEALGSSGVSEGGIPLERARLSTSDEDILSADRNASIKHLLDKLEAKLDDLEGSNMSEDHIWDSISEKLQKMLDGFVVQHREDGESMVDASVKKLLIKADFQKEVLAKFGETDVANRAELENQANDLAGVIYREAHIEDILTQYRVDHASSSEKLNQILAALGRQDQRLKALDNNLRCITTQVKHLLASQGPRPVSLADLESCFQARIDESCTRLKQDVSNNLGIAQRNIFARLEEQHHHFAQAIWPKLQRTLFLTDMMCDLFAGLSVPPPHNEHHDY